MENKIKGTLHLIHHEASNLAKVTFDGEKSELHFAKAGKTAKYYIDSEGAINIEPQHLYVTTDEEIKEGDIALNMFGENHSIFRITKVLSDGYEGQKIDESGRVYYGLQKTLRKIVATTNPELWEEVPIRKGSKSLKEIGIAKIDSSFIEQYIKAYNEAIESQKRKEFEMGMMSVANNPYPNKGDADSLGWNKKPIKEVWLEVEKYGGYEVSFTESSISTDSKVKLTPDGCVIIHSVEERMYTRGEMKAACARILTERPELYTAFEQWFDKAYPI